MPIFSLPSMPTELADGLGLRGALPFFLWEFEDCSQKGKRFAPKLVPPFHVYLVVIERWIRPTYYLDFVYRSIASLERQSFYGKIPDFPYLSALVYQGDPCSIATSKKLVLSTMQRLTLILPFLISQAEFKVIKE